MNKYYTPKIEEFHVGFEYEKTDPIIPGKWDKKEIRYGIDIRYKEIDINTKCVRVKYLDIKDIKSLGLNHVGGKLDGKTLQQFKGKVFKGYYLHITTTRFSFGSVVTIETSVNKNSEKTLVVHTITIKNNSELKKLLKQLNII